MPFAWMTLSSTQRCSSKRLTTGSPTGLRIDQSRVFVAAPAFGASAAAAGATALASAAPAAAANEPDCRKARRSMMGPPEVFVGRISDPPHRRLLPVSLAAIPGVEQIGEPVIAETGDLMNARQADQPGEPAVARGCAPDRDRAVGADEEAAIGIDAVQPAAHIRQGGAEAGERIGLQIDVAEFDSAGAGRAHQPAALPVDAGVTDRAFGIVPDRELRAHRRLFVIDRGSGYTTPCSTSHTQGTSHDRRRRHRPGTLGQIDRRSGAGQEQAPAVYSGVS